MHFGKRALTGVLGRLGLRRQPSRDHHQLSQTLDPSGAEDHDHLGLHGDVPLRGGALGGDVRRLAKVFLPAGPRESGEVVQRR